MHGLHRGVTGSLHVHFEYLATRLFINVLASFWAPHTSSDYVSVQQSKTPERFNWRWYKSSNFSARNRCGKTLTDTNPPFPSHCGIMGLYQMLGFPHLSTPVHFSRTYSTALNPMIDNSTPLFNSSATSQSTEEDAPFQIKFLYLPGVLMASLLQLLRCLIWVIEVLRSMEIEYCVSAHSWAICLSNWHTDYQCVGIKGSAIMTHRALF